MKKLNNTDYKALEIILKNEDVTRTDLTNYLEITAAAVSKIVKKLINYNLIKEDKNVASNGGRPRVILKINKSYKKIIGVNFGSGFIDLSVGYIDGSILETKRKKFYMKMPEKLKKILYDELNVIINKYGKEDIISIGLALNGVVNSKDGILIFSPHLKWKDLNFKEYLENIFNIPVIVDNDVRAMLKAEMFKFLHNKYKNIMLLYLKDGIGSSIAIDDKIYEGDSYCAGEIGHYVIDEKSNFKCKCGKYGCLESECSAYVLKEKICWELEKEGKVANINEINIQDIFIKALNKESPYYEVIKNASFKIGKVVGNVVNVLNIENIIVVGDILQSEQVFLKNFYKGISEMLTLDFKPKINIFKSNFGNNIEKYASVYLVVTNLFSNKKIIDI